MGLNVAYFVVILVVGFALCQFIEATDNKKYEHDHVRGSSRRFTQNKRHHHHGKAAIFHHSARNKADECNWVCSHNGSLPEDVNGSWIIYKRLSANHTIILAYNATANFFSTWDKSKHLASIQAGSIARTGIYNSTSQLLFIVSTATNKATLLNNITINFSNETQLTQSFSELYEIIAGVVLTKSEQNKNIFNITTILSALQNGTLQNLNSTLFTNLTTGFEGYLKELTHLLQTEYNGISVILVPILLNATEGVLTVFMSITNEVSGYFPPVIALRIFTGIIRNLNDNRDKYLTNLSNVINGIGKIYGGLQEAISSFVSNNSILQNATNVINLVGNSLPVGSKLLGNDSLLTHLGNISNHLLQNGTNFIGVAENSIPVGSKLLGNESLVSHLGNISNHLLPQNGTSFIDAAENIIPVGSKLLGNNSWVSHLSNISNHLIPQNGTSFVDTAENIIPVGSKPFGNNSWVAHLGNISDHLLPENGTNLIDVIENSIPFGSQSFGNNSWLVNSRNISNGTNLIDVAENSLADGVKSFGNKQNGTNIINIVGNSQPFGNKSFENLGNISNHLLSENSKDFNNITRNDSNSFGNNSWLIHSGNIINHLLPQNGTNYINVGGKNIPVGSKSFGNNSWLVHLGNSSSRFLVRYNSTTNTLGVLNGIIHIIIVFNGNSGDLGLFNTTSGVGLVQAVKTGNARVVTANTSDITKQFKHGSKNTTGFQLIDVIIKNNSNGLDDLNNSDGDVFNFRDLIYSVGGNKNNQSEIYSGRSNLSDVVNTNFGKILNQVTNTGVNAPLSFFRAILGLYPIGRDLLKIIVGIFTSVAGQFNPLLMSNVFGVLNRTLVSGIEGIANENVGSLDNAIKQAGQLTGSVADRIQQTLLNIPRGDVDVKLNLGAP